MEYNDTVSLGDGLVINEQSIGVASESQGFSGVDGILVLGPVNLTEDTLDEQPDQLIPTVTDTLFAQNRISSNLVAVSFQPTTTAEDTDGELSFGQVNPKKFIGDRDITYVPTTTVSPANEYWGIDQAILYGENQILKTTAGIIDTGLTMTLLATDAFEQYRQLTGTTVDPVTGLLKIMTSQVQKLQPLSFLIGDSVFMLSPDAQIWPRALNLDIGGRTDDIYLIIGDLGIPSDQALDFVNGMTFYERFFNFLHRSRYRQSAGWVRLHSSVDQ